MPAPSGEIPVRVYLGYGTESGQSGPALLFFHGGGWVMGDLDTHDALCRGFANIDMRDGDMSWRSQNRHTELALTLMPRWRSRPRVSSKVRSGSAAISSKSHGL